MKRTAMFFAVMLVFCVPFSAGALEMGPDVAVLDGQQLKWTDGSYGYHVMFKSLLANLDTANDYSGGMYNPQADACLDSSAYLLDMQKMPIDAQIEKAFIIWTAAQPTAKLNDLTDNTVRLDFIHESEPALNGGLDVVGREAGLTDEQDFEFESFRQSDANGSRGFFTHRVEVTDFFKQLQAAAREEGKPAGSSLYGIYTVSGLDCTTDAAYLDMSVMVANWSIILIYSSAKVPSRDIYLYHGVASYQHVSTAWSLTGFALSADPKILLTLNTIEGDAGLVNPAGSTIAESLKLNGPEGEPVDLYNKCNFLTQANNAGAPFLYTEVFNSISSVYGLDPAEGEDCVGPVGNGPNDGEMIEYAIDMDTFYIDGAAEPWAGQFPTGSNTLTVTLGANQDSFFTNFLILAVDREPDFDIPSDQNDPSVGQEKLACTCRREDEPENIFCKNSPMFYLIKVQNWGVGLARSVTVVDDLPPYVEYVPGTIEMATQLDKKGNGIDWTIIPDGPENTFPLSGEGYKVAESMKPCDQTTKRCADSRLIRFKVTPIQGIPANVIVANQAFIRYEGNTEGFLTNGGSLKLRVTWDDFPCQDIYRCPEPPKSECGGGEEEPVTDSDTITGTDEDTVVADEPAIDDTTTPDTDTKKDGGGCGCSVVF